MTVTRSFAGWLASLALLAWLGGCGGTPPTGCDAGGCGGGDAGLGGGAGGGGADAGGVDDAGTAGDAGTSDAGCTCDDEQVCVAGFCQSPNATCTTGDAGRTCSCNAGFVGDGGACVSVDQCAVTWAAVDAGPSPAARERHRLSYDARRHRVLMFGGQPSDGTVWAYADGGWSPVVSSGGPNVGILHAQAYDVARDQLLVFGGWAGGSSSPNTYVLVDGGAWAQVATTGPPARRGAAMAYDAARSRVILFGGRLPLPNQPDGGHLLGDTWAWNGSQWTQLAPATRPAAREQHALALDPERGRLVLFGGNGWSDQGNTLLADTWELVGDDWILRAPRHVPTASVNVAMAYDAMRHRMVLWNYEDNPGTSRTWEWDGVDWASCGAGDTPQQRIAFDLAWDAARGRVVMFGGQDLTTGQPVDVTVERGP